MAIDDLAQIKATLAPTGVLRAAINLGNAVLAQKARDGSPSGITVDLAQDIATKLSIPVHFHVFDSAGKTVEAMATQNFDIGFLAIDPLRAATIDFTAPYVRIEGAYIVRANAPFKTPADIDRKGVRVAVGKGAVYDLHLTRTLKQAELVRYPTSGHVFDGFLNDNLEAGANIRQPAVAFAAKRSDLRVLDESFMEILQAIALPKGRDAAFTWLEAQVKLYKQNGFIAAALKRAGQDETLAAPL
jgi:polar amino acid transport system substrate-binding protein